MTLPQKKFREIVFQILYSLDMGNTDDESIVSLVMKETEVTKKNAYLAKNKAFEIYQNFSFLDQTIESLNKTYAFERIHSVERNILRLSIYELFFEKEIPAAVVISEAIRLTKKFSTQVSVSFVHAILDQVVQKMLKEKS